MGQLEREFEALRELREEQRRWKELREEREREILETQEGQENDRLNPSINVEHTP